MTKLTLSVDRETVERAKRFARRQNTSVSALVQNYLNAVAKVRKAETSRQPRVLRALRGSLAGGDREEYLEHLEAKYRTGASK